MKNKKLFGSLLLLLTALIWGSAFVSQRLGMSYIEPLTFNSIRTLIGGLFLLPFIPVFCKKDKAEDRLYNRRELILGSIICGAVLCLASSLQQIGLKYTSAGKAGFITALYILLVPIFGLVICRKVKAAVWGAIIMAVAGLYMLCLGEKFVLEKGDFFVMMCAITFALHILAVGHFAPKVPGVKLACYQFIVAGFLGMIGMFIFETPRISDILSCALPILYAGIFSCGIAYTLQVVGQRYVEPAIASLIMSFESVFAAISGWLILGECMTGRELAGCALMFCAIILAQRPDHKDVL